jgi:hypothetical protein
MNKKVATTFLQDLSSFELEIKLMTTTNFGEKSEMCGGSLD